MADGLRKLSSNINKDIPHDITERKHYEQELERLLQEVLKGRQRLRLAQEAAVAGTWDWDVVSKELWWSPEYYSLYGLDPKKVKPSYDNWLRSIHPDDRKYAHKAISEVLKKKKKKKKKNDIDITFRILHPKKGLRWTNARGRIYYDKKGNALRMAGVSIDITERKRIQDDVERHYKVESLLNSLIRISVEDIPLEKQLKRFLEAILSANLAPILPKGAIFLIDEEPDVLVLKTEKGFSDTQKASCNRVPFGKCLCGKAIREKKIIFTSHIGRSRDIGYKGISAHGHYIIPLVSKEKPVGVLALYVKEGHRSSKEEKDFFELVSKALSVIIERKKTEKKLRREQIERLTIFDSVPALIFFKDKENNLILSNKGLADAMGLKKEEMEGKSCFELWPKKQAEDFWRDDKKVMQSGRPKLGIIEPMMSPKGERWVQTDKIPYRDEKGEIVGIIGFAVDITERKNADEALRESEERYRNLLLTSPDAVLVHSKGKIRFINPAGMKLFRARREEELLGKSIFSIVPKEFHRIVKERIRLAKKKQTPLAEFKFVRLDGSIFDGDATGKGIIYQGSPAIQVVIRDISERRRAQENLHKLNRTLKALSDSNQALIHATNEQRYLQQICRIIVKDCGYALVWAGFAEQDKNKRVRPVAQAGFEKSYLNKLNISWADTERGRGPTGTAIRTGKPVICKNILTDPNFKPWRKEAIKRGYRSLAAFPMISNNKAFGSIGIYSKEPDAFTPDEVKLLTDLADDMAYGITAIRLRFAHKQAEGQLKESETKFRLAFENAQDAMLWADTKTGILIDCNSAAERLFERPKSEIIGQHQMMLHPSEAREYCRQLFKEHASEKTSSIQDAPIITKSGKIKTVMISAVVVRIKEKKIIQGIFRDITERKEMEAGLTRSNAQLSVILDNVAEGLVIADLDGNLFHWNPAAVAMHGFATEEECKRKLVEFTKVFELSTKDEGILPVEKWPLSRILKGEALRNWEVSIRRLDRDWSRVFSYGGTLARDKDGKPILAVVSVADITERKKAEEAMRLTQFSVDHASDAIAWTDKNARFLYVNEKYRQTLGYSRKELFSMHVYDVDLNFTKKVWQKHWEVIKKQSSFRTESLHRAKNGRVFPIEVSANYFKLGDKEYSFAFIRDISERKQAEEALKKAHDELELKVRQRTAELTEANKNILYRNEILKLIGTKASRKEFLESVIELLKAWSGFRCLGIRVLDEEGRIPYDAYTGFSREFWESENWLSIKDDQCACIRVIKGKPELQDLPAMTKAGSFYTNNALKFMDSLSKHAKARFRGVCVRTGFKSLAVIPIRNRHEIYGAIHLADEKEGLVPLEKVEFLESLTSLIGEGIHKFNLEDKIRKDHAILDAFFKHAATPFVFLDPEFNFIRVNEAYAKACRREVSDFPGHNHFEFYPHGENERIFREVVKTKTPFQASAKPFVFPEHPEWGVSYWDWTLVPIVDNKGNVEFLVFSLNDVTERKLAEEKLSMAKKELETAKRLSDIGVLAATVAHELRNPLGVIRTAAYNIKRKAQNPQIESHLGNIEKKILESDQIINNLLFYSRLKTPRYESVRFYDILNECINSARIRFGRRNIRIIKKISSLGKAFVEVDPVQMAELFNNILNNAYDALMEKKGTIEIRAAKDSKGNLEVACKDNGVGIDKEHLKNVFEPFFTTKAKGTGLGLTVCNQIATLHGGKIAIDSEKGRGTTVTVTIPMKE